jgi:AcrR family transcriptional regulator
VTEKPLTDSKGRAAGTRGGKTSGASRKTASKQRYRRLPKGTHGLDPELVKGDQRERLIAAMVELIAAKGYPAVRISDLSKLAHVSPPTLYSLYADKEELFLGAYEDIARRAASIVLGAYDVKGSPQQRLPAAMRAFAELAVSEPQAISLLILGAFGAGPKALERRRETLRRLEQGIQKSRDRGASDTAGDLTVKAILGGIREVASSRLRDGREHELPELSDALASWAASYPRRPPRGLLPAPDACTERRASSRDASARARRARGALPSGPSDMPRQFIVKSQRERIVDATAAIVAEKGLAGLTIPEIARRANVSNQTFYAIYPSKNDAFLGAQKIGLHQALRVSVEAYDAQMPDWPRAIAASLRALLDFLASEPAHAHLALVDTFAVSPEAIKIRSVTMQGFGLYLRPGYDLAAGPRAVPEIVAEAVVGGIWQILHHYVESDGIERLPGAAPQLIYFALAPFLGPEEAAAAALSSE